MTQESANQKKTKAVYFEGGKMYFTRKTERSFFFILTMIVLIVSLLTKMGFISI